jgi:hypothetical protein
MNMISSVPLLLQSYNKIKRNKGILTPAAGIPPGEWNKMHIRKKRFLLNTIKSPDGISFK